MTRSAREYEVRMMGNGTSGFDDDSLAKEKEKEKEMVTYLHIQDPVAGPQSIGVQTLQRV
jgi:hypothetical protein